MSASTYSSHTFAVRLLTLAAMAVFSLSGAQVSLSQTGESNTKDQIQESQSLSEQIQLKTRRLDATEKLDNRLIDMLASIPQPAPDALTSNRQRNLQLSNALAAVESAFKDYQTTNPTNSSSVTDLEKTLADLEKKRDQLVNGQTDQLPGLAPTNGTKGLRREVVLQGLNPVLIMLVKNRAVPMQNPFYSIRSAPLVLALTGEHVDGIVATRVQEGESIGNAIHSDGLLDTLLKESNPGTDYFKFIVCADSILAFRRAAEAVSARGFTYAWEPGKDEVFMVPNNQAERPKDRGYAPPHRP